VRDSHLAYLVTAPRPSDLDPSPRPSSPASRARGSHSCLDHVAAGHFASDCYPAPHGRASQPSLAYIAAPLASDSEPRHARGSQQLERTAVIRCATGPGVQVFAVTVVIPALVGIVVGLAALL
jgi:hypothetical protein